MDSTDLSNLVGRLERKADRAPGAYVAMVAMVAALGYACVAVLTLVILIALYLTIASLLSQGRPYFTALIALVGGGALLVSVVRALLVRVDTPAGRVIFHEDAPTLFAAIQEVAQKMALTPVPKGRPNIVAFDSVRLNREFSVAITQVPRWGVFGGYRNHLQIGIPLLAALNLAEFKAVLAHEIGHLGREYNWFSAWIYRQRVTWQHLGHKFEEPTTLIERMLAAFYSWYVPYFRAYTLVLARDHEYGADRAAGRATHIRVLARALTKVELVGRFLSEVFWKRLFDQVEKAPEPRYLPYAMLPRALDVAQKQWLRNDWLQQLLHTFATDSDTHPSLSERLNALDAPAELPSHSPGASALALLGTSQAEILKWCDSEWEQENRDVWRKKHEAIREARWKLSQYQNMPAHELQAEGIWEKAVLLLDLGQDHDAIETLRELATRGDAPAKAHLELGKLLLAYGDEQGLKNLSRAGQQDPELLEVAGQIGYDYLMDRGRRGEAQRFWEKLSAA